MAGRDSRLAIRESLARGCASQKGRIWTTNAMRIFYLVVTMLLIITLGLLEVVAARSVSLTP